MTAGQGVRADWLPVVTTMINLSIFILPLLLPVALCLFAFSDAAPQATIPPLLSQSSATAEAARPAPERTVPELVEIECNQCAWAGAYASVEAAQNALNAHQAKHTREKLTAVSSNGNGNGNHHE